MKRPSSGVRGILLLPLILVTLAPTALVAQEGLLDQISRQTGISKEELARRSAEAGVAAPADSGGGQDEGSPGRVLIPVEIPPIVLPLSAESRRADSLRVLKREERKGSGEAAAPLFGRDFFHLEPGVFAPSSFGPVPDDYRLGIGDQVVIQAWGDVEFRLERIVDRDGTILLPKGGKIRGAGRTLAELAAETRTQLARVYSGLAADPDRSTMFLDVSLGKLRAMRVFVIGDAAQPGAYELSSVSTVFAAVYAAGGPAETGSMRDIRLVRGEEVVARVDLYGYLMGGARTGDALLREFDTVFIPPRGTTVELRGAARRPMRFELREGESVADLLRFGGGFLPTAATEVLHLARILPPDARRPGEPDRTQIDVHLDPATGAARDPSLAELRDGDVVTVDSIGERNEDWVEISGAVKRPGRYQFTEGMDAVDLVTLAGMPWPDYLPERAAVDRVAPDGTYESIGFPIGAALAGTTPPMRLRPMDQLRVFSRWELTDRQSVSISGEVRQPGNFAFREGLTLRELILKAGGLQESADRLQVEVSRPKAEALESSDLRRPPAELVEVLHVPLGLDFLDEEASFMLRARDHVSVRKLPWWEEAMTVVLLGEVLYPGTYTLLRPDERLSEVIARASGLKPTAFPAGARILRTRDDIGNIAVDLVDALKRPGSPADPVLVNGDQVIIPPTPHTVKVVGVVGFPTSVPFVRGKKPGYYVDRAGGYAEQADMRKTRVVYPNGLSRPARRFRPDPDVLPGSTIVVPPLTIEPKGNRLETLERIASIIASAATTYLVIDRIQ